MKLNREPKSLPESVALGWNNLVIKQGTKRRREKNDGVTLFFVFPVLYGGMGLNSVASESMA